MVSQASGHRGSLFLDAAMRSAIVIKGEEQRDGGFQVLPLLAESIGQARESSHLHSDREVLALNDRRADSVRVGVAKDDFLDPISCNTHLHHYPALELSDAQALAVLGDTTSDIYLNDAAYWRNVPARVWGYTLGGYQVIKKWLSYRENSLLNRALTTEEAREVMQMARRIAAILLLEPQLDANYAAVKAAAYGWPD